MRDREKTFKTACGVVSIIATILRVILIISAIMCIFAAIVFAIGRSHIDLNAAYAELQKQMMESGMVALKDSTIEGFLGLSNVAQIGIIMSILLVTAAGILAISMIFQFLAKFLKNLETKKSPFIPENVYLLRKMARWMLGVMIGACVVSIICSIATGFETDMIFGFGGIELLLIAFGLVYIFDYGCRLEEKAKKKSEKEKE